MAFCVTPLMDIDQRALEEDIKTQAGPADALWAVFIFTFLFFSICQAETEQRRRLLMGVNLSVPQRSRVWYHSRHPGFHLM